MHSRMKFYYIYKSEIWSLGIFFYEITLSNETKHPIYFLNKIKRVNWKD